MMGAIVKSFVINFIYIQNEKYVVSQDKLFYLCKKIFWFEIDSNLFKTKCMLVIKLNKIYI